MSKRTCSIEGCDKPTVGRGWCGMHWARWKKHGDPLVTAYTQPRPPCAVDGCEGLAYGRGWCNKHWLRWRKYGDPLILKGAPPTGLKNEICLVDDCAKPTDARGWCSMHYARWMKHGSVELPVRPARIAPPCSIDGCDDPADSRGWCNRHYIRWRNHGDPQAFLLSEITEFCSQPGCARRVAKAGLCWKHYRDFKAKFLAEQGGRCAICGVREEDAPRKTLLLDHDHVTRQPRSLLCHNCNCGLGHFRDDPARLRAAIAYLAANSPEVQLALFPAA
jgi:hypothetical protein